MRLSQAFSRLRAFRNVLINLTVVIFAAPSNAPSALGAGILGLRSLGSDTLSGAIEPHGQRR
jgi:hypothetical protein